MGQVTLRKVRDGSWDPLGCPGRVKRPSQRSGMGRGPFGWSGTGQMTLGEVREGSGDPRGGPGPVEENLGGPKWVEGTFRRSRTVYRIVR